MSPSLFNVYMDVIMREVTEYLAGGMTVAGKRVLELDIADDVAFLADTWLVILCMVMQMEEVTERFGINTSAK